MLLKEYISEIQKSGLNISTSSIERIYNARLELLEFTKEKNSIYLYGAGNWGKAVAILLKSYQVDFKAFIITDEGKEQNIFGHDVLSISSVKDKESATVIVCVASSKVKHNIVDTLKKTGVSSIYQFSVPMTKAKQLLVPVTGEIKFSVLMPVYNADLRFLDKAIESVKRQNYMNWELCVVDDCSTDETVHEYLRSLQNDDNIHVEFSDRNSGISDTTNKCASIASGDYLVFMDDDDELSEDALFSFYERIYADHPDVIYSDMDLINESGEHFNPLYKPDWSPDLLRCQMYVGHLLGVKTTLFTEIGGFRKEYDGAQDYDLMLRLSNHTNNIIHVDKILYSWRSSATSTSTNAESKPYAQIAGQKTLIDNLKEAPDSEHILDVQESEHYFVYDVRYKIPTNTKASIVIPTKDHVDDLDKTIKSIYERSSYTNFEIIILNNNSIESKTQEYLRQLKETHQNILVEEAPYEFNWSKLCNHGISISSGDVLIMLNNDVEVISSDWLERLISNALRPNIGIVGSLLLYPDGTIQHGGVVAGFGGWADHLYKNMPVEHCGTPFISSQVTRNVTAVTGACMAFSRNIYNKIGGFDEQFIICGSDVEYCIRAIRKGYRNLYLPQVKLYHYESKSRKNLGIPDVDHVLGDKMYSVYREQGDPYYNNNLDYNSFSPKKAEIYHGQENADRYYSESFHKYRFREIPYESIRINLVIPSINSEHIFGGIATAINLFQKIVDEGEFAARIILVDAVPNEETIREWGSEYHFVAPFEDSTTKKQIMTCSSKGKISIPIGKNDFFLTTAWWTAYDVQYAYDKWTKMDKKANPVIYLIQDYEPGFYAWSSHYLMAESTYKSDHKQIAIFNSKLLYDFYKQSGYEFYKEYYFQPVLNSRLREKLLESNKCTKEKIVLFYGRPNTPRNAYSLLMDGLKEWADSYISAKEWRIISAGEKCSDILLNNDVVVENVGKMTLDDYGEMLRKAYAGISLMVSPHPSYPPLEMAAFGVKVITNQYANKDLSSFSKNIISLKSVTPKSISDALISICEGYHVDCLIENECESDYLRDDEEVFSFVPEIIELVNECCKDC